MRDPQSYRSARRNEHRRLKTATLWHDWNALDSGDEYSVGSVTSGHRPSRTNRSAYMPHVGGGRYQIDRVR